ncbi:MAG TPA: hypothetical protein VGG60_11000, partial [Candidatus Binataceae bacterium]
GNLVICAGLATLLIGMSWGSAHAQTKLVKPANGGTLKITKSGSYFLAANYISTLPFSSIISISANNVTINLNGFTISDTAIGNTAPAISTTSGISGVTIVNGTITKTGTAISLGTSSTVGGMQLIGNKGDGVDCISTCLVTNSVITGNTGAGLALGDGSSGYQDNIISGNTGGNVGAGTNLGNNVCGTGLCP